MLLKNSSTLTTVKNELKSDVRFVPNYLISILDLLIKLSFGAHIATMLYSSGSIVMIAQFINAIMIITQRSSTISINLIL